jgi:4-alpha-glucanotransferase
LPGPNGIGEIGPEAFRFAGWLAEAGQRIWQVLPIGPTGYGDSPYQCFSAFAGNPLLLSLDRLVDRGYLDPEDLSCRPRFPEASVDYGAVIQWKFPLLANAAEAFFRRQSERDALQRYCGRNADWLDDFSAFMAAKEPGLRRRSTASGNSNSTGVVRHCATIAGGAAFALWAIYPSTWLATAPTHQSSRPVPHRRRCRGSSRLLQRDRPIRGQSHLPLGQVERDGYEWWIDRFRAVLERVDMVRLDHFRGFEAYWKFRRARRRQ